MDHRAGAPRAARVTTDLPEPLSAEEEDRSTAASFAVALKLDGPTREQVENRLATEFGRRDAPQIADEVFSA